MIADLIKSTVIQNLGPLKESPKGWLQRNCMLCHTQGHGHDRRGRFGIKFLADGTIVANCFNCGFDVIWRPGEEFTEKFSLFLREIGLSAQDIKALNFEAFRNSNNILPNNKEIKIQGPVINKWHSISLPDDTYSLTTWLEEGCDDVCFLRTVEYALKRKFDRLDKLYWTPCKEKQFNKRLLLPFIYNGEIVGYTGRYFANLDKKQIPKYINQMPDSYIYNLDVQKDHNRKYVILVEGVFDAWTVDGISPINNTISPEQVNIINSLGKIVIVCPDKDKDGNEFVKTALEQGWHVAFPKWGRGIKDAAQASEKYGRILTVKSIIDSVEDNPMKITLKWKLGHNERYHGVHERN